jgi:S1-C subfamily serine protease
VITAVNGQPVNNASEIIYRMSVIGLGKTARITRIRNGEARDVDVLLMAAPDEPSRDPVTLGRRSLLPGLRVERINPAVTATYGLPFDLSGVLVTETGPIAPRVGIRQGDVILAINDRAISHPDDVVRALSVQSRSLVVLIQRGERRLSLRMRM